MWLRIMILTVGAVAIGTELFGIAGILTVVADDLGVSVTAAGQLITLSAVAYAVGSPLLVALAAHRSRRRVLIGCMAVYGFAAVGAAVAPDLRSLAVARVVIAAAAALYFPTAAAVAAALAPEHQRGRALAAVQGGTSIALVVGVPVSIGLADVAGWRASYLFVAAMGFTTAAAIAGWLPAIASPLPARLRERLRLLGNPAILTTLAVTVLWMMAGFTVYTYIRPVLTSLSGVTIQGLGSLILAYGIAGIVGSAVGGGAVDRWGARSTAATTLALLALNFLLMPLSATSIPGALLFMIIWGANGWGFAPAQQHTLMQLAPGFPAVALALNASATYVGIALGAALGGVVVGHLGAPTLGVVAGVCDVAALAIVAIQAVLDARSRSRRRVPAVG